MSAPEPLPMILHCPVCGEQHIDEPDPANGWLNPPHRSHECQSPGCHFIWRPADVPTTGVQHLKSVGSADAVDFRATAPCADDVIRTLRNARFLRNLKR